jgi:hypothetical protein
MIYENATIAIIFLPKTKTHDKNLNAENIRNVKFMKRKII